MSILPVASNRGAGNRGRLANWAVELKEYDIEFKNRVSMKTQVLAVF